jgi:hypothetical protein
MPAARRHDWGLKTLSSHLPVHHMDRAGLLGCVPIRDTERGKTEKQAM